MKKITIFFALLICVATMMASPVDPEQARTIALNFMAQKSLAVTRSTDCSLVYTKSDARNSACFYVYNVGGGFVIVSANDRVIPILGYSTTSTFNPDNVPDNMANFLDNYRNEIAYCIENQIPTSAATSEKWQLLMHNVNLPSSRSSVSPLLQTSWGQQPYYNELCPADADNTNSGHAVTGCVATAMAQIIRYWQWPVSGFNSHNYDCQYGNLSVDYSTASYNYNNMPTELTSESSSAQINEVAKLMRHCGVAVDMNYGASGSGAPSVSVPHALRHYFAYSNQVTYVEKSNYSSSNWESLIKNELNNARPVYYSGSGDDGGHAFVCDGYDDNNYFHINWGWRGSSNGYFTFSALSPDEYDFSQNQAAVIGISASGSFLCCSEEDMIFYAPVGGESPIQTLTVRGHSLSSNITITAGNGFLISINGTDYGTSAMLPAEGGNLYVKFSPSSTGNVSRTMTLTSGSITKSVSLSGTIIEASCLSPKNLAATSTGSSVNLSWDVPVSYSSGSSSSAILSWDNTVNSYYSSYGDDISYCMVNRFVASDLNPYHQYQLTQISFVASYYADSYRVVVYKGGSYSYDSFDPGVQVFNQIIPINSINPAGWNTVTLGNPILIDASQELWYGVIAYTSGNNGGSYVIRYGTNETINGKGNVLGLVYGESDEMTEFEWVSFENGNFPIKGLVEKVPTDGLRYDVYRQNTLIGSTTNTTYTDNSPQTDNYTYIVSAVWGNGCSADATVSATTSEPSLPIVTTAAVTDINYNSATSGGDVISDGGESVTAKGICWSTSPNPTLNNSHTISGNGGTGSFSNGIILLTDNTTYYVRAYATNSVGTAYGNEVSFTTTEAPQTAQPCPVTPTVTDIDGNVYNTVLIGQQCWMRDNLRTRRYADNTVIEQGNSTPGTTAYWYYPNNNASNETNYGLFYNWKAVMKDASSSSANPSGVQGICPTGWHVPSDAEWTQLMNYVSSQSQYVCGSDNTAIAKALASHTGWRNSSLSCVAGNTSTDNNATGFGARPAGCYWGPFGYFSYEALFWSSTEQDENNAAFWRIQHNNTALYNGFDTKPHGISVRCIRDEGNNTSYVPSVTTTAASDITESSAICGGNVISDGNATVTARGVCWSTNHNPTLNDRHTSNGSGTGNFSGNLTGLTAGTTYFVRAYATNSMGTAYGNEVSFATPPAPAQGVTVILEAHDVWNDGTGYQLLLDADATAYGTIIPTSGGLTSSGDASADIYAEFEYKIPENADGALSTNNMVMDGSIAITIPAGTYDFCITNPTPGDRMWIAAGDNGRKDDYVFQDGWTYHFTVAMSGSNDAVTIEVIPNGAAIAADPTSLDFGQTLTTASAILTTTITGYNLTDGITATVTGEHYTISADGTTFATTASLSADGGPLYVQYAPTSAIADNGTVTLTSGDVTTTVSLSGVGFECGIVTTFPYQTNFSNDALNSCWTIENANNDDKTWSYSTDCAYYNYSSANAADDWLISPVFTLTGNEIAFFDYKAYESSYPEKFEVYVIHGSTRTLVVPEVNVTTTSYTTQYIDLRNYTGNYQIGIHCTSAAYMYRLYVTNFTITTDTPSVQSPTVDYAMIGFLDNTTDLNFTTGLNLEINEDLDLFPVFLFNGPDFPNSTDTIYFDFTLGGMALSSVSFTGYNLQNMSIGAMSYFTFIIPASDMDGWGIESSFEICCTVRIEGGANDPDASNNTACITVNRIAPAQLPSVTTSPVTDISATSAICGGNVTDDGGSYVYYRGVCYGTTPEQFFTENYTMDGAGTGTFTSTLTNLIPNTTYYVRAYAYNDAGTAFGEEYSFTTPCNAVNININGTTTIDYGQSTTLTAYDNSNPSTISEELLYSVGFESSEGFITSNTYNNDNITLYGLDGQQWGTIHGAVSTNDPITGSQSLQMRYYGSTSSGNSHYGHIGYCLTTFDVQNVTRVGFTAKSTGNLNVRVSFSYDGGETFTGDAVYTLSESPQQLNYYISDFGEYPFVRIKFAVELPYQTPTTTVHLYIDDVNFYGATYQSSTSFLWSNGAHGSTITVSPTATTTYTVTGTNQYGCTGTASTTVIVTSPNANLPTVTTNNVTNNTTTTAICGGNVTSDGGAAVTARGVCWSTSPNPSIGNSHTSDGNGIGSFSSSLTGLTPNTTYYVRAYAINSVGTAYGNEVSFSTSCGNVVVEISGNTDLCEGDVTTLTATGASSYQWNTGTTGDVLQTGTDGTYSVIGTDTNGCWAAASVTVTVHHATTPPLTVDGEITACNESSATLSVEGSYTSFLWSTGDTTPTIEVNVPGYYWVVLTDEYGCDAISEITHLGVSILISETPSICMVGVENNHNLIVWEDLDNTNVRNYRIYRENDQANVFELLATIPASMTNAYEDTTANPSVRAYRYKLTAMDICQGETPMSEFHKTIHLTINRGIGESWNLIWTPYEGMEFPSYRLYRGTTPDNLELIATIPSNLTTLTDFEAPAGALYYQIEMVMESSCQLHTRDTTAYTGARSNIVYNGEPAIEGISVYTISELHIYPNPTTGIVTIELANETCPLKPEIQVFDVYGKMLTIVETMCTSSLQIDLSQYATGVYVIKVVNDGNVIAVGKVVKE